MRIAFIAQSRPHASLGGGRPQFEITREWERAGLAATLLGPEDLLRAAGDAAGGDVQAAFAHWLGREGQGYDIVDYDHNYLPPESLCRRTEGPVLVARSILFIPFAPLLLADDYNSLWKKIRVRARTCIEHRRRPSQPVAALDKLIPAIRRADAFTVPTGRDAALAAALGLPGERILTIPYAISREAKAALNGLRRDGPAKPNFVFLGSFDARKGGPALPGILEDLRTRFPGARLTVLGGAGAGGDGRAEQRIRRAFSASQQEALRVVPAFQNEELPSLLAEEAVGIFPSRFEGFPNAILEQGHAGIPVAAYDAPGASEQLPAEWLAAPGDAGALARCAGDLMARILAGEDLAAKARAEAGRFLIEDVAEQTRAAYLSLMKSRRR